MAEFEWQAHPNRPSLRRAIRHRLQGLDRPCRIIAEDFLAARSRIDLLGVGDEGELVSVRIGIDADDATLLTRSLSDLTWLRPRTQDLLKLVPRLGIEASAEPRAMILCPDFHVDTLAAIQILPADRIELIRYRSYRLRGQLAVVLEAENIDRHPTRRAIDPTDEADEVSDLQVPGFCVRPGDPEASASGLQPLSPEPACVSPSRPNGFRTGLSDTDLRSG